MHLCLAQLSKVSASAARFAWNRKMMAQLLNKQFKKLATNEGLRSWIKRTLENFVHTAGAYEFCKSRHSTIPNFLLRCDCFAAVKNIIYARWDVEEREKRKEAMIECAGTLVVDDTKSVSLAFYAICAL